MKFRKKPVVIEAIQWTGSKNSFDRVRHFCPEIVDGGAVWHPNAQGGDDDCKTSSWPLFIQTLEGAMCASIGDYIIKGVNGEFYPCKPDIFEKTYSSEQEADSIEKWPASMNFGFALAALKLGCKLQRAGWNGKNQFVYYVKANTYPAVTEVAKKEFGDMVPYAPYIALKNAQNSVVPWLPSQGDLDAEDWCVIE